MYSACLFFIEKPQNQKARIFRQGKNIINKKKIIKIEPVKRWKLDCKTKKQPEISDCRDMFYRSTIKYEVLNHSPHLNTTLHALPSCYPSG